MNEFIFNCFRLVAFLFKGSSVIRMLETFQEDNFQKGVSTYLKKYKFKNALTDNLWSELNNTLDLNNTVRMLNSWTKQKGYPLISVQMKNGKIVLTQKKCLSEISASFDPNDSPFRYAVFLFFLRPCI